MISTAKLTRTFFAALAAISFSSIPASALTTSGTGFQVSITVTKGCLIDTDGSDVDFGSVAYGASLPSAITRTVAVRCTNGTVYSMYLTSVNTMSGTTRFMTNGAESVPYTISYSGTPVGAAAGAAPLNNLTADGTAQSYALSFAVSSIGPVTPQTYTDTVTLQVDF
ncbi:MAG: spore coat protein U domain-containing protein [Beijerinckiaceae bacterium]